MRGRDRGPIVALTDDLLALDALGLTAAVKRSALHSCRNLITAVQKHLDSGKRVRVITTTYTGSTEAKALDKLQDLGMEVKVSYDTTTTRLHAKAWLFHRETGQSTVYIGSSNLTHSAQVPGGQLTSFSLRCRAKEQRPHLNTKSAREKLPVRSELLLIARASRVGFTNVVCLDVTQDDGAIGLEDDAVGHAVDRVSVDEPGHWVLGLDSFTGCHCLGDSWEPQDGCCVGRHGHIEGKVIK